jgi:glycosyltransferase involved in cell wall biosynthesis
MNFIPPTRVGFTLIGGKSWTGGHNYLINLFSVLSTETPGILVPVIFVGTDVSEMELQPFRAIPGCQVIQNSSFNANARSRVILQSVVLGYDPAVRYALRSANIDVVFESGIYLGWRLHLPLIAWIPDLQHRFLPGLFTKMSWMRRELGFRLQILSGRYIMCSSLDTLSKIEYFYPSTKHRISAVRFAIKPLMPVSKENARLIVGKYGYPQHYFFMPNQFWAHKNHRLVLSTLQILKNKGKLCTIVAPGQQLDPRNIEYVPSLLIEIEKAGLKKYFLTPGLLPYEDLLALMQASSALINPSLFEGWSTTVEEARSVGVRMILSDIAVHREQAGEDAFYFNPNSAEALADILISFSPLESNKQDIQRDNLKEDVERRVRGYALDFIDVVQKAVKNYNSEPT